MYFIAASITTAADTPRTSCTSSFALPSATNVPSSCPMYATMMLGGRRNTKVVHETVRHRADVRGST